MYMGGFPENVRDFFKLKKKLNCYLIEDSCHAFGAEIKHSSKSYKIDLVNSVIYQLFQCTL